MAFGNTSILPVAMAGFTNTDDEEKSAYATLQARLHWPQYIHSPRSLLSGKAFVRMDKREGITFTPAFCAPFLMINSCKRGLGGGRKIPSGSFSNPSLLPKTPNMRSMRS